MKLANRVFAYCAVLGTAYGTLWWGLRDPEPINLTIDRSGRMALEGQRVDGVALRMRLSDQMRDDPLRPVVVLVDPAAPGRVLFDALEIAREVPVGRVDVVTRSDAGEDTSPGPAVRD